MSLQEQGLQGEKSFRERITDALTNWAERHQNPDDPFMGYDYLLSPREMVYEVTRRTEVGNEFLRTMCLYARVLGEEGVIDLFEPKTSEKTANMTRQEITKWEYFRAKFLKRFKPDEV